MNIASLYATTGTCCAFVCAMFLGTKPASALSCATNFVQAPANGATDVPTNARLWGYGGKPTRLLGPSGPVPLDRRFLPIVSSDGPRLPMLVPERELGPHASYTIEVDHGGDFPVERTGFVTASGPAEQSPPPLELLSSEAVANESIYGIERYRALEFSHGPILVGDVDAVLGPLSSIAELEQRVPPNGPVEIDRSARLLWWARQGTRLDVGIGPCLAWPDQSADQASVRFGAFDLAGNFSGWLELPALELPTLADAQAAGAAQRTQAAAENEARLRSAYGTGNDASGCLLAPRAPQRSPARAAMALALGLAALTLRRRPSPPR
ncbi:MAG: hypothetical protein ABI895_35430 [Deltaproteobacteria bacterium]